MSSIERPSKRYSLRNRPSGQDTIPATPTVPPIRIPNAAGNGKTQAPAISRSQGAQATESSERAAPSAETLPHAQHVEQVPEIPTPMGAQPSHVSVVDTHPNDDLGVSTTPVTGGEIASEKSDSEPSSGSKSDTPLATDFWSTVTKKNRRALSLEDLRYRKNVYVIDDVNLSTAQAAAVHAAEKSLSAEEAETIRRRQAKVVASADDNSSDSEPDGVDPGPSYVAKGKFVDQEAEISDNELDPEQQRAALETWNAVRDASNTSETAVQDSSDSDSESEIPMPPKKSHKPSSKPEGSLRCSLAQKRVHETVQPNSDGICLGASVEAKIQVGKEE